MARKKRKAVKSPPSPRSVPIAGTGGIPAWLFPALGWLALVLAWLAMLGGVSDQTLDWRRFFHLDPMRMVLMFNDWNDGDFPVSGWRAGSVGFVPQDYVFTWLPLFAGADFRVVLYLFPLVNVALAAAGWLALCDFLFGKSPARRTVVLILSALSFLQPAWRGGDLLLELFPPHSHSAAWTIMPWQIWACLRALEGGGGKGAKAPPFRPGWLAAMIVLTAGQAADGVALPWFVAPVVFAAASLALLGQTSWRAAGSLSAAAVVGYFFGRQITHLFNPVHEANMSARLKLDPAEMLESLREAGDWAVFMVSRNPAEAVVWAAFAFIATWRMFAVAVPALRRRLPPFMALPDSTHAFLALFIPASAGASLASMIVAGYFVFDMDYTDGLIAPAFAHRLQMPLVFFPLFVGWALLPWGGGVFRLRSVPALAAALLAVGALSGAKALAIRTATLDPLASPFQQCFAENAERLGWSAGVASVAFGQTLTAHPDAGVERMMHVSIFRAEDAHGGLMPANPHPAAGGDSILVVDNLTSNENENNGEFQFAVANVFRGRVFYDPPREADKGCPMSDFVGKCGTLNGLLTMLDEETIRRAFGEPKEVIDCAGVGFLHYDPPLRFDESFRRHYALLGRW